MARILLSQTAKLVLIGGLVTFLLSAYTFHPASSNLRNSVSGLFSTKQQTQCSPELWASGQWTRHPKSTKQNVTSMADVLEMQGFAGCASDREYRWHLGSEDDQWYRFPEVTAYQWTPPASCNARQFDREDVIRDMVEKGGWLLLGGESIFALVSWLAAFCTLVISLSFSPHRPFVLVHAVNFRRYSGCRLEATSAALLSSPWVTGELSFGLRNPLSSSPLLMTMSSLSCSAV